MPEKARSTPPSEADGHLPLTPRELQVASWLGEDDTYAQIAVRLGVGHDAIRIHARNILRKLGARTRHAAVARLHRLGIRVTQKGN